MFRAICYNMASDEQLAGASAGTAPRNDALAVAQYTALRNEIAGHQRDEVTAIGTVLTVMGAIVTIATWQSVVGILVVVPAFLYVTWRKLISGTTNTFRIASFLRAYYETPANEGLVCWEHAIEVFRQNRDETENRLAWRRANVKSMRWLIGLTVLAALVVFTKTHYETLDLSAKARFEAIGAFREIAREASAPSGSSSSTPAAPTDPVWTNLETQIRNAESSTAAAHQARAYANVGGLVLVLLSAIWAFAATCGPSSLVGESAWRERANERMRGIREGTVVDKRGNA